MTRHTRVLATGDVVHLGSATSPLQFATGEDPNSTWRGRRYLELDSRHAFELSYWCGTFPFLFQRMEGANRTLSIESLSEQLNAGINEIEPPDVLSTASGVIPEGDYLPILLEMRPRLVHPMKPGDYFSEDQSRTWGIDAFWGLPEYPRTPYYRATDTDLGDKAELHEVVVPMVPPSWNDATRVTQHELTLADSSSPTCLALSIVDICQPAVAQAGVEEPDRTHWCLAHFLLDGHHKLHAAAKISKPVRLLCLLAVDQSIATRDEALSVPSHLQSPPGLGR